MINAVDTDTYNRVAQRLITLQPSNRTLCMADGSLVPSLGIWRGAFEWDPVQVDTTFKVFPSGASWQMLVGKPLLEQVRAVQDYSTDTIQLPTHTGPIHIKNYTPPWPFLPPVLPTSISSSSYNSDILPLTTETNHIRTNLDNLDHMVTDQTSHLLPEHFTTHSLTNTDRSDEEVLHLQMEREGQEREHGEEELKDMVEGCCYDSIARMFSLTIVFLLRVRSWTLCAQWTCHVLRTRLSRTPVSRATGLCTRTFPFRLTFYLLYRCGLLTRPWLPVLSPFLILVYRLVHLRFSLMPFFFFCVDLSPCLPFVLTLT